MKIRKILTLIFMTLLFAFSLGAENSEIENTWVTNNPNAPITTIKTNRQKKEGAKLNIEVNKIKSREINGVINRNLKEIYFNLTDLEKPVTENDIVYVTEELETFPSVAETNGKKRYSNVMEKYVNAYKNNTPVENNGLKSVVLTNDKSEDADGQPVKWKKALKVTYENEPASLFIGVLDKKTYELKSIYAWYNAVNLIDPDIYTGTITYSSKVLEEMVAGNIDGTHHYVGNFYGKMDIVKDTTASDGGVTSTNSEYITVSNIQNDFLKVSDPSKVKYVKIYEQVTGDDGSTTTGNSVELTMGNITEQPITLDDGSVFSVKAVVEGKNIKLSLVPVIFGTKNRVDLYIDLHENAEQALSNNKLTIRFPEHITHEGITIKSSAGNKNTLAPTIKYTFGKKDNDLDTDKANITGEPRNFNWYVEDDYTIENYKKYGGIYSEGKNLGYFFYLLNVIKYWETGTGGNFSVKNNVTAEDELTGGIVSIDDRTITVDYGRGVDTKVDGTYPKKLLLFTINSDSISMQVKDWDMSSITQTLNISINMGGKKLYTVPIMLSLPKTKVSTGSFYFQFYRKYEQLIKKDGGSTIASINGKVKEIISSSYGTLSKKEGEDWHDPENLIGMKGYIVSDGTSNIDINKYHDVSKSSGESTVYLSEAINGISLNTRYIYNNEKVAGLGLGFTQTEWENFTKLNSKITPVVSAINYYGLEIGRYTYEMSVITQRERTITFDNLAGIPGVNIYGTIVTGKIYGASSERLYSVAYKTNEAGDYAGRTGEVIGNSLSGDRLRYYGVTNDYYVKIEDENGNIVDDGKANKNDGKFYILNKEGTSLDNIIVGFDDFTPPERMDTTEKSLYIILECTSNFWSKYGDGTTVKKNYTIVIEKTQGGEEVYRDNLNLVIKKSDLKEVKATVYLQSGYNDNFITDGNYLIADGGTIDGKIVGSIEYEVGKAGDIVYPPGDTSQYYYSVDIFGTQFNGLLDKIESEGVSFIFNSQMTLKLKYDEARKTFIYSVKYKEGVSEYMKFIFKLYKSKDDFDASTSIDDKALKKYDIKFNSGNFTDLGKNASWATITFNEINFSAMLREWLENNKNMSYLFKTDTGITGDDTSNNIYFKSDFKSYNEGAYRGLFLPYKTLDINTENDYLLTVDNNYKGQGKFTKYRQNDLGNRRIKEEDKLKNIRLNDGTYITFGAALSTVPVVTINGESILAGDFYIEFNNLGDNMYPSKGTGNIQYALNLTYPDTMNNKYKKTTINLEFPRIQSKNINLSIANNDTNKNGLCPNFAYYFGYEDGKIEYGSSNHATGVIEIKDRKGGNPFIFYRANEISQMDYHYFFEFESKTPNTKTSKNGNSWVIKYPNNKEITFDIIGSTPDDNGMKNKIKMRINKWDESPVKDEIMLRVFSTTRQAYMEIPITIDLPETKKYDGGKLKIILDSDYKGSVVSKLHFQHDTTSSSEYPENAVYKVLDSWNKQVGILLAEKDGNKSKFNPVRTTDKDNVLRGATKFKIHGEEVGDGKYHEEGAFKIAFNFDDSGANQTGNLQMGVSTVTGGYNQTFPLEFENDYGITIAEYEVTVIDEDTASDKVVLDFGDISPANRYFETAAEATVELDNIITDIKVSFSNPNPVLTLNGQKINDVIEREKLYSSLLVRSISKDRLDSKKWNIDIIGRLKPITVADQKLEGEYRNPDSVSLIIEVPESTVGTRKIKK